MIDWIKEHPYLAGSLGVGLLLVFIMIRKGASSSAPVAASSGIDPTIAAAQIASGNALQQDQTAANVQVANFQAQQNIAQLMASAQTTQAQIAADTTNRQTAAALQLGLAQVAGTVSIYGTQQQQDAAAAAATATQTVVNNHTPIVPINLQGCPPGTVQSGAGCIPIRTVQPGGDTSSYQTNGISPDNSNWAQFWGGVNATLPNTTGAYPNPAAVAIRSTAFASAQDAYAQDPNSCHNEISAACGNLPGPTVYGNQQFTVPIG